jgi:methionyl-tRNA formyltransferase
VAEDVAAPAQGGLGTLDGRLFLGAGDGAVELLAVQPAGGKPMDAAAWLRGRSGSIATIDPDG